MEKRIHEIKTVQLRRRHREQQEMARHKAQLERDRQVARLRGPEGERARQGLQQPGVRPQFRAPILQTVRHNSPQLSPIQPPRVSFYSLVRISVKNRLTMVHNCIKFIQVVESVAFLVVCMTKISHHFRRKLYNSCII